MGKRRGSHAHVMKITQRSGAGPPCSRYNVAVFCPRPFQGFPLTAILPSVALQLLMCIPAISETSQTTLRFTTTPPELPVITRPLALEPIVVQPPPAALPAPHAFWDRRNRQLFAGILVFRALDYASTRNMQARGREEILLPDEVANNDQGFAALELAGTATSIALSYWMHRTGHHRLERWISIAHISVTGFGVVRNYSLESRHAR